MFGLTLVGAGAVLFWPALRAPFVLDDYLQASMAHQAYPVPRAAWNLYDYINPSDASVLRDRGFLPWWSDEALRIRFLRPLPSLALWCEYRLGASAWAMHLHSFAWWALGAKLAHKLYSAHVSPRAARIAVLVFALAPFQVVPIAWLANREALISVALCTFALSLQLKRTPTTRHFLFSTAAFAVAFSSGEYALAACGYVAADAWIHTPGWTARLGRVAPAAIPAAMYLALRARLGYGAGGSGFYTDPFHTPGAFLARAPERFARLWLDAWAGLDGEQLKSHVPTWVVVGLLAALGILLRTALTAPYRDPKLRVFFLGSALSLLPFLAVVPSPRVLGLAMLGIALVVARILENAWWPPPHSTYTRAPQAHLAALFLGFSHLIHGPASSWLMARSWSNAGRAFERNAHALSADLARAGGSVESADVTALRGIAGAFFVPFALSPQGVPPRAWRLLSQAGHVLVRRTGERELELVAAADQSLVPIGPGNLFRPEGKGFQRGQQFETPGMRVTVTEVSSAGVRRAKVQFARMGDTQWMVESSDGFLLIDLPDLGFGLPLEL